MPLREKPSGPRSASPLTGRELPGDDRRFYTAALTAAVLIFAITAGYLVYRVAFNTVQQQPEPRFDLSSLFIRGRQPATPPQMNAGNPCMVVQEHLEALRRKDYEGAFEYLATPLRDMTGLPAFTGNARRNAPLMRDVETYQFGAFKVRDGTREFSGHLVYETGGRSDVEALLVKEFGRWRIVRVTVIYE
jgi:hypothetical protein